MGIPLSLWMTTIAWMFLRSLNLWVFANNSASFFLFLGNSMYDLKLKAANMAPTAIDANNIAHSHMFGPSGIVGGSIISNWYIWIWDW